MVKRDTRLASAVSGRVVADSKLPRYRSDVSD